MSLGAVVGLDIGNATIKVTEVHSAKGQAYISALGIAPTPLDSIDRNMVLDPALLGTAIKELLVASGARAKHVVSSVAGQQSLVVRIIEVPKMTERELAETMKWEVERHVPFASSAFQMDYQIIQRPDAPPDAQTMEVLLVVAQQEMLESHLEAVERAGLSPVAIDIEPLAEARSLVAMAGAAEQERTVALVNVGAQNTDISIVRGGNLLFQRTITTAGNSLTEAIATRLNIGTEEAERIKKLHAVVDMDAFAAGGGLAPAAEEAAPFGFGVPVFETPAEAPAAPQEPAAFNPFATDVSAAPPAAESVAPQEPTAAVPPVWSPFGDTAAPTAAPEGAPSPFGPAPEEPAAAPAVGQPEPAAQPPAPSPFEAPAPGAAPESDAFDLSAFAAQEPSAPGAAEAGEEEGLTPRRVFDIIREPLTDLVTEIRRSVDYFRGRSAEATLDLMVLSGGTALLPNLDQLLSSELGVPVIVADPFRYVPVQTKQYPEEYLRQIAPLFAVSVGLALRETVF